MKYLKRFNEHKNFNLFDTEDVDVIKEIFQEFADNYFLTRLPGLQYDSPSALGHEDDNVYDIFIMDNSCVIIEVVFNYRDRERFQSRHGGDNIKSFDDELEVLSKKIINHGYEPYINDNNGYYKIYCFLPKVTEGNKFLDPHDELLIEVREVFQEYADEFNMEDAQNDEGAREHERNGLFYIVEFDYGIYENTLTVFFVGRKEKEIFIKFREKFDEFRSRLTSIGYNTKKVHDTGLQDWPLTRYGGVAEDDRTIFGGMKLVISDEPILD